MVADYIIDYLYKKGVRQIFMVAGGGIMYLTDALARSKIKAVCMHNEQALGFAVKAKGMLDGFGVGLVTTGIGATNVISGVAEAWLDSVPCLFLVGQTNTDTCIYLTKSKARQIGVQEINSIPLVKSITKYCAVMEDRLRITYHLNKAFRLAYKGRAGPVWLEIPLNISKLTC